MSNVIVDWISISLPGLLNLLPVLPGMEHAILPATGEGEVWLEEWLKSFDDLSSMHGRSPFRKSIRSEYGGWRYYYDADQGGSLLEISGMGCKRLRDVESDLAVVQYFADRITRIDLAVDIECSTDPEEFVASVADTKFKSSAVMRSGGGTTVYKGSRKSDRYVRVYRYNAPHPRSKFLRVEMVCKGRAARPTCERLASGTPLLDVASAMGNTYGWQHKVWDLSSPDTIEAAPRRYHASQTERWLITQVLPACAKLAKKGETEGLQYLRDQLTILISEASKEV